jgi:hypothetical protein
MAKLHNNNCDGSHCCRETGEVRLYPTGGGGNMIYCNNCFRHENAFRAMRVAEGAEAANFPAVAWQTATVYKAEEC